MSKKILGLDIRRSAVSAVVINSTLKNNRVDAYAYIPFPEHDKEDDGLSLALESLVEDIDTDDAVCVASFPIDQISFRNIRVPFKQKKKIRQILPFELEPIMPVPVDELIIDFHTTGHENQGNDTGLLTAAVSRESLQRYLDQLSKFNIVPETITAGGYSTALCLSSLSSIPANSIFLEIDDGQAFFAAIADEKVRVVRVIPTGPKNVLDSKSLCLNIKRTIAAFNDSIGVEFNPERIFLTGAGLRINGLENDIGMQFQLPTQRIDLIRDTKISAGMNYAARWEPEQIDSALALVLMEISDIKSLDFRKGPFARSRRWAAHKQNLIRSGVLLGALMILFLANSLLDFYSKKSTLENIKKQIVDVFKSAAPNEPVTGKPLDQLKGLRDQARADSMTKVKDRQQVRAVDVLNQISTRIPEKIEVELTMMSIGEENILTSGNTDTFNSVDTIKSGLEKAEIFKTVTIVSTKKEKSGKISFKLKIQL